MSKNCFLYLLLFYCPLSLAQTGGTRSFQFLNVPNHARLAGLGGVNVSLVDRDINFLSSNPALVGDTLAGNASASYQFYVADIGQSSFSYVDNFKKVGLVAISVQHLNYGTITGYDVAGVETGEFHSGETAIVLGKSHTVNNFRLGVNLKTVFSSIAGYRASAMMIDAGGVFIHPQHSFTVGMVIKNAGFLLSRYATSTVRLPFDVQAGTTFKPEHMPIRFSITAYNLSQADIVYYDPAGGSEKPGTLDKVFRHINFGAEILLHRHVNVLLGYNFLRHKELKLATTGGGAGLTFGFSVFVKSFEFVFSRGSYITGTAGYNVTLTANLKNILKKRAL